MTDITIRSGQVNLAMSVYGPTDGVPLLFLHGLTMSRDTWYETIENLGDRYRAWALDLRGHGHSDRASDYRFADYVSDARAALTAIGAPTVLVGHSLGAMVAGALAQSPEGAVRAAFLEDPPWYLGDSAEFARTLFPKLFEILRTTQAKLQTENAPLESYLRFVANAPNLAGGKASDHIEERQLLSHASALQRQHSDSWSSVDDQFSEFKPDRAFQCPAMLIQADPTLGAAFLDGHELRFARAHPSVRVARYVGCGHAPHRTRAFEGRFRQDLAEFLSALPTA